ncbi:hypothetical protein [Azospirillum argentinense]|uniref:hypothetical protein n=1 Tax=Azospirillum argentinense TaxID=2970906 RepID=UPI0032DF2B9D
MPFSPSNTIYLADGRYPMCRACGAVGQVNPRCPKCVVGWSWLPWPTRKRLLDLHASGNTGDAVALAEMHLHDALAAVDELVGKDWQAKLRMHRAAEEWRQEWELRDWHRDEDRRERRARFSAVLREWCRCEDNHSLNGFERFAYGMKALICLALGLRFQPRPAHGIRFQYVDKDTGGPAEVTVMWPKRAPFPRRPRIVTCDIPLRWNWKPMSRKAAESEAADRACFYDGWQVEFIDCGTISSHSDGSGWEASWISVPHGWTRWGYRVHSDGDSYL